MIERKGRAYKNGKENRKTQKEKVFGLINICTYEGILDGIDTDELVKLSGLKIHSLSARLSELEQDGRIYQNAKHSENGVTYTVWKATPLEMVENRRAENWNKRQAIWINKGIKNGFISKKELLLISTQSKLF